MLAQRHLYNPCNQKKDAKPTSWVVGGGVKDLLIIGLAVQVAAFYVYCYTGRVSL